MLTFKATRVASAAAAAAAVAIFWLPRPSVAFSVIPSTPAQGSNCQPRPLHHPRRHAIVDTRCVVVSSRSCSNIITTITTTTRLDARAPSKWDGIVDEGDVGATADQEQGSASVPVPPDMTYEPRNVQRQHENFLAIRGAGGKEVTNDVYVRNPKVDVFWYAGKVARVSDVSLEDCVARQWHMIERHATNLRPLDLYPHRGRLEIWTAPGDSELEVAYNRPDMQLIKMTPKELTNRDVRNNRVGFQGEIYQEREEGFRTWRTDDGFPARPEINPGGENRPPTDEEYTQIQRELEGKDIQDVYEEQERRKEQGLL